MEEMSNGKKNPPTIPENYVSLLQLQKRWIEGKEGKRKETDESKEPRQNLRPQTQIEDEQAALGDVLEQKRPEDKAEEGVGARKFEDKNGVRRNRTGFRRKSRRNQSENSGKKEASVWVVIGRSKKGTKDEGSTEVKEEASTEVKDEDSTEVKEEASTEVKDEASTEVTEETSTEVKGEGSTKLKAKKKKKQWKGKKGNQTRSEKGVVGDEAQASSTDIVRQNTEVRTNSTPKREDRTENTESAAADPMMEAERKLAGVSINRRKDDRFSKSNAMPNQDHGPHYRVKLKYVPRQPRNTGMVWVRKEEAKENSSIAS